MTKKDDRTARIYLAIGEILCRQAELGRKKLTLKVAEISTCADVTRPTVYKRNDVIALVDYLRNREKKQKGLDGKDILEMEKRHSEEIRKISAEKIRLLARIESLEARAANPKR